MAQMLRWSTRSRWSAPTHPSDQRRSSGHTHPHCLRISRNRPPLVHDSHGFTTSTTTTTTTIPHHIALPQDMHQIPAPPTPHHAPKLSSNFLIPTTEEMHIILRAQKHRALLLALDREADLLWWLYFPRKMLRSGDVDVVIAKMASGGLFRLFLVVLGFRLGGCEVRRRGFLRDEKPSVGAQDDPFLGPVAKFLRVIHLAGERGGLVFRRDVVGVF